MEELKSCPFCRGSPRYKFESGFINSLGNFYCTQCNASSGGGLQTYEQAVKSWNTRPAKRMNEDEIFNLLDETIFHYEHRYGWHLTAVDVIDMQRELAHAICQAQEKGELDV